MPQAGPPFHLSWDLLARVSPPWRGERAESPGKDTSPPMRRDPRHSLRATQRALWGASRTVCAASRAPRGSSDPRATKRWAEPGAPLALAPTAPCQPPTRDRLQRGTRRVPAAPPRGQKAWTETSEETELETRPGPIPLPRERRSGCRRTNGTRLPLVPHRLWTQPGAERPGLPPAFPVSRLERALQHHTGTGTAKG